MAKLRISTDAEGLYRLLVDLQKVLPGGFTFGEVYELRASYGLFRVTLTGRQAKALRQVASDSDVVRRYGKDD